jgi:hypothetical protein
MARLVAEYAVAASRRGRLPPDAGRGSMTCGTSSQRQVVRGRPFPIAGMFFLSTVCAAGGGDDK